MKIVIIGAKGQLGSDCCDLLNENNTTAGCDIPAVDIGNKESVDSYVQQQQPDVIVNCAAYTAVDACETEKEQCWKINCEGPQNLAQAASNAKARLIHISTDYVFDGRLEAPTPYTESMTTNPLSEYGKSKLAGEQAVINHCRDYIILRTAWLYSAWGKNFLKTMLRLTVNNPGKEFKVVDDQYGSLTWSYTLAQQIKQLLHSDFSGIAHSTANGYSTWYGAACYFLETMNIKHNLRPCTTAEYPTPAHRPANSILANSRLEEAGISTFRDWKDDIDSYVKKYGEQLLEEANRNNG